MHRLHNRSSRQQGPDSYYGNNHGQNGPSTWVARARDVTSCCMISSQVPKRPQNSGCCYLFRCSMLRIVVVLVWKSAQSVEGVFATGHKKEGLVPPTASNCQAKASQLIQGSTQVDEGPFPFWRVSLLLFVWWYWPGTSQWCSFLSLLSRLFVCGN